MYTIKKFKQQWDISLSKSYAHAFQAALSNFDTYKNTKKPLKEKKPAFAGL
jgi:hypothetical protein